MRVIRAAGVTKLRDDAGTYKTQRVQPSYGEASCGAKRQVERRIVPESFQRFLVFLILRLPPTNTLGHEPTARGFEAALRAGGRPDDVTALRGEALAGAEAHVREDAGVGRALRLLLDALDEVVAEEVSCDPHERV